MSLVSSLPRRLASQSAIIFAARIFGAGIVFVAQAVIARNWGATGLADYLIVLAAVNLVAMAMPLGFNTVGTFFAARYRASGDGAALRRFVLRAYLHIGLVGIVVALGGPLVLPALGETGTVLAAHFLPLVLIAASTAMVWVSGAVLVGLKRPFAGLFADAILRPLAITAALLIALVGLGEATGFEAMFWLIGAFYGLVALGHMVLAVKASRALAAGDAEATGEGRLWWRFALPWAVITLATDFFFDIDLLLLSGLLAREELAIFGVCARIFALVAFAVSAIYALTLPDMFEEAGRPDTGKFNRRVGEANLVATGLALCLVVGVAIGGPLVLMLFGPEFGAGALPLTVLCLGLVVRAVFGPAALVLSMQDRPYATFPAIAVGMGTLVIANLVLVPAAGLMGAALAALLATSLWSAGNWLTAARVAGIDVSIFARLRSAPASGPA